MSSHIPEHQRHLSPAELTRAKREVLAGIPTKPTKALVAALLTLLGLMGVTLTDGQTQLLMAAVQLLVVSYGVWRTVNAPKGDKWPR
jgi:hypothetical protein